MPVVFTLSPLFLIKDHLCGKIPALSIYSKAAASRKGCKLSYSKLSNPVPFEFRRFGMMFFLRRSYIEILLKPLKVHAATVILYHNSIFSDFYFHYRGISVIGIVYKLPDQFNTLGVELLTYGNQVA